MEQSCITVSLDNSLNEDGYICQICSPFKYEPTENKFYQHLIMSHYKEKLLIRYGILVYNTITVYTCEVCKEKFIEADLFLEHCALTHDKVFIKKMYDKETMTKSDYEDLLSKDKNRHPNKEIEIIDQWNEFGREYLEYLEANQIHQDTNSKSSMENTQLDSNLPLQQQNGYKSITPKIKKSSNVSNSYSRPPYSISQMPLQQNNVAFPYSCPDCWKTFPTPSQLESHKLFHMEIKPFFCLICFKDFYQKNNLKDHICEQESGEQRFDVSHLCTIIMD